MKKNSLPREWVFSFWTIQNSSICLFLRWGYKRENDSSDTCILDEEIGYRAVLKTSKENEEDEIQKDSIFDFKLKPVKKKKIPWTIKAIYKLNYASAFVLNHTMEFYNLAGLETWARSWNEGVKLEMTLQKLLLMSIIHMVVMKYII